jgi:hypothetical protein
MRTTCTLLFRVMIHTSSVLALRKWAPGVHDNEAPCSPLTGMYVMNLTMWLPPEAQGQVVTDAFFECNLQWVYDRCALHEACNTSWCHSAV